MINLGMPIHELLVRMAIGLPATIVGMWLVVVVATLVLRRKP